MSWEDVHQEVMRQAVEVKRAGGTPESLYLGVDAYFALRTRPDAMGYWTRGAAEYYGLTVYRVVFPHDHVRVV